MEKVDSYEDQLINVGVSSHMRVERNGDVVNIWDTENRPNDFPVVIIKLKRDQLVDNLQQVDDVLIVNWITVKNNDYRQALADLVTRNIQEREDPALNGIAGVAMRHRETGAIFSIPKPARHDSLIRELVKLGEPEFAKGEQGFVDVSGAFLTREEAFVRACVTGQLLADGKILFSEDLW